MGDAMPCVDKPGIQLGIDFCHRLKQIKTDFVQRQK